MKDAMLYVLWRIDGDFTMTVLSPERRGLSNNALIEECIKADAVQIEGCTPEDVQNMLTVALDQDSKLFQGYEISAAFVSADVEFLNL